jgi:heme/copper-type cytochrome/quinol oxidase subunit 3
MTIRRMIEREREREREREAWTQIDLIFGFLFFGISYLEHHHEIVKESYFLISFYLRVSRIEIDFVLLFIM